MDVFAEYKPLRNKIASLATEEALATVWAYTQYLQIDEFQFPAEIEVSKEYLKLDVPQRWVSEWELELLAKEVIINGNLVAKKGRELRAWKTLSEIVNLLKDLEGRIYRESGSPKNVLVEMVRIAHRQFIWQGNPPNSTSIIRHYKIFDRPKINQLCRDKIGLSIWEIYMCGVACMGFFLSRPAIVIPFKVEIKALSVEAVEKFVSLAASPLADLRDKLKAEQQYNANFAYAYNSLRAYPLVKMRYQGSEALVCPLMTLLYWRFTSGLYYELIGVPEFANEFGEGFSVYVGEVIERACPAPVQRLGEQPYMIGKAQKRSVDWIVADNEAALFVESKVRRITWAAKSSLVDLGPLETDIDNMAAAVVQIYKTTTDYLENAYPHFPAKKGRKIFPVVVTLENWRMFGPVMMTKLRESVEARLKSAALPASLLEEMPYSIWAIEELEVGLQIMSTNGIAGFMEGKLTDQEMRQWDWHGYMTNRYPKSYPAKKLFEKDYDEMFSELYRLQEAQP